MGPKKRSACNAQYNGWRIICTLLLWCGNHFPRLQHLCGKGTHLTMGSVTHILLKQHKGSMDSELLCCRAQKECIKYRTRFPLHSSILHGISEDTVNNFQKNHTAKHPKLKGHRVLIQNECTYNQWQQSTASKDSLYNWNGERSQQARILPFYTWLQKGKAILLRSGDEREGTKCIRFHEKPVPCKILLHWSQLVWGGVPSETQACNIVTQPYKDYQVQTSCSWLDNSRW